MSAILVPGLIAFAFAAPAVAAGSSAKPRPPAVPLQPGNFALRNLPTIGTEDGTKCLGIGSTNDAGIWRCTYANDQNWHLGNELNSTGYNQVINAKGQCLGIAGGSEAEGAQVVGWTCDGPTHTDQYWTFDNTRSTGDFWIFNYKSPYVVGVAGGSTANGAAVIMWNWQDTSNNQAWEYYSISG